MPGDGGTDHRAGPRRPIGWRRMWGSAVAALALATGSPMVQDGSGAEPEPGVYRITINGKSRGVFTVLLRDGEVLIRPADLARVGVSVPAGRQVMVDDEPFIPLASLAPAVTFSRDDDALVLDLVVAMGPPGTTVRDLRPGAPTGLVHSEDSTAFLNAAVTGIDFERYRWTGEAGLSIRNTLLTSTAFQDDRGNVSRGLSSFSVDDRRHLVRWLAGDRFDASGPLGGRALLGGLSVSREFALDPYFVRFPTVGLAGATLSPSTAEVYVNGQLVQRETIPVGAFELRNLPVPLGSGTAQIILRDAFGRAQEIVSPFYFTPIVLRAGVQEFSYDVGFQRDLRARGLGEYGPLAFVARHRIGLTDDVSPGGHVEARADLVSGGPSAAIRLPIGALEVAGAGSRDQHLGGWAASLAYSYTRGPIGVGFSAQTFSDHYATLSLRARMDRAKLDLTAIASAALTSRATVTVQYGHAELRDMGSRRRAGVTVTMRLSNWVSFFATGSRAEVEGSPTTYDAFGGVSFFLGDSTTATVSNGYVRDDRGASRNRSAVEVQRSLPLGAGYGYRVQVNREDRRNPGTAGATTDDEVGGLATLQYQGGYGFYEGAYQRAGSRNQSVLTAAVGVAAIGGGMHVGRPVQDSFALIRVPGVPGVRGYLSNQEIGRTNARGDLLVPNLLPYYGNRLGVGVDDFPIEYTLTETERVVGPPFRGGAIVTFPARRLQAFTGHVVIGRGEETTIPAYGRLVLRGAGTSYESPIAEDGEIYLENVPAGRYPAEIEQKQTTCRTTVDVPASDQILVELGTIRCVTR